MTSRRRERRRLAGPASKRSRVGSPQRRATRVTRLGARVLLYGPLNSVVHHQIVEQWLDILLPFEPGHESEWIAWGFCLTQLARSTGQRALDVDDSHRQSVLTVLRTLPVPAHWIRMVEDVVRINAESKPLRFTDLERLAHRHIQSPQPREFSRILTESAACCRLRMLQDDSPR